MEEKNVHCHYQHETNVLLHMTRADKISTPSPFEFNLGQALQTFLFYFFFFTSCCAEPVYSYSSANRLRALTFKTRFLDYLHSWIFLMYFLHWTLDILLISVSQELSSRYCLQCSSLGAIWRETIFNPFQQNFFTQVSECRYYAK